MKLYLRLLSYEPSICREGLRKLQKSSIMRACLRRNKPQYASNTKHLTPTVCNLLLCHKFINFKCVCVSAVPLFELSVKGRSKQDILC